jgi:hypothetical protein
LGNITLAQTFSAVPGSLLSKQVAFNQASECYIYFQNNSGDTLRLHWRKLELSMPQDWVVDLCDYGSCYAGVPSNSLMNPIYGATQAYLKLLVSPGTTPGSGWAWFRVYEEGHPDNFVDVYYSVYTPGVTGTTNLSGDLGLFISPNPADQVVSISNVIARLPARLINSHGEIVWQGILEAGVTTQLNVQHFPVGMYFLQSGILTKKIIVQR